MLTTLGAAFLIIGAKLVAALTSRRSALSSKWILAGGLLAEPAKAAPGCANVNAISVSTLILPRSAGRPGPQHARPAKKTLEIASTLAHVESAAGQEVPRSVAVSRRSPISKAGITHFLRLGKNAVIRILLRRPLPSGGEEAKRSLQYSVSWLAVQSELLNFYLDRFCPGLFRFLHMNLQETVLELGSNIRSFGAFRQAEASGETAVRPLGT